MSEIVRVNRGSMFPGRGAAMCCVFLAACTAGGTRDAATPTADTVLATVQAARGADSVPAVSSATILSETDTVVTLGMVERDLTGDGRPEVLRLTGVGQPSDSLDVTLVIESSGDTVFQARLLPLTRTVGFDAGRRKLSPAEYRTRLDQYGGWFFGDGKFARPAEFVEQLGETRRAAIPYLIARDRRRQMIDSLRAAGRPASEAERNAPSPSRERLDSADAVDAWEKIQRSGVTVFTYSPGGDAVFGIVWSARDRRFYRLWECC
jgi:hypothetical protein